MIMRSTSEEHLENFIILVELRIFLRMTSSLRRSGLIFLWSKLVISLFLFSIDEDGVGLCDLFEDLFGSFNMIKTYLRRYSYLGGT